MSKMNFITQWGTTLSGEQTQNGKCQILPFPDSNNDWNPRTYYNQNWLFEKKSPASSSPTSIVSCKTSAVYDQQVEILTSPSGEEQMVPLSGEENCDAIHMFIERIPPDFLEK